jgi:hypothetical protein
VLTRKLIRHKSLQKCIAKSEPRVDLDVERGEERKVAAAAAAVAAVMIMID